MNIRRIVEEQHMVRKGFEGKTYCCRGSLHTTCIAADAKLIFAAALRVNANKLAVSHNHPSGTLKPSNEDITLTQKLAEAGKFLDLPVLDHLIIAEDGYYSFCDEGLI